jgi:hypothetical protein
MHFGFILHEVSGDYLYVELTAEYHQRKAPLFWNHWHDLGLRERHWTAFRRRINDENVMEMVLLHQPYILNCPYTSFSTYNGVF